MSNDKIEINEKTLLNRDPDKIRTKRDGAHTYLGASVNPDAYQRAIKRQQEWVKENYFVYALPLNVNYEGDLIWYIDQLDSVKPYICDLIRKEMANPCIECEPNIREFHQNGAKRRSFSMKLIKQKPNKPDRPNDQDVIDYLCTKPSKRNYLIRLLRKDIEDKGVELPEEVKKYNEEFKIEKPNLYKDVYKTIYGYLQNKLDNNINEFEFADLLEYCRNEIDRNLKQHTFSAYRREMFSEPGVIEVIPGTTKFKINRKKFKMMVKPE